MTSFFPHEADIALMSQDDNMAHLFPSSTCQSPPSIMYSPPLHQMTHRVPTTHSSPGQMYASPHDYRPMPSSPYPTHPFWTSQPPAMPHTHVTYSSYPPLGVMASGQSLVPEAALLSQPLRTRSVRSHSASSLGMASTSTGDRSPPSMSRSISPSSPDLRNYGYSNKNGTWSCAYPGCTSRAVFTRGCDLRKHHKRHTKSFFCRHEGCPQATGGGFSSKKDLARHEAKHNPGVLCDWDGCDRVFSRVDNMRDHVKRIHLKASRNASAPKPSCS
ncbi:hypothetical protein CC80DRAFT_483000 [Byssothecium circinans]|uniref:C2H2-type domain-containing protein n=1 Tax=Byssothecium circinans TaxID=147558 RepID=A0A6A5TCE9_9PLEO|nr:hypothetical protein CC80DRAFT_483000 [Byssothecium circinans]